MESLQAWGGVLEILPNVWHLSGLHELVHSAGLQQWWPMVQSLLIAASVLQIVGWLFSKSKDVVGSESTDIPEETFCDSREKQHNVVQLPLRSAPNLHGTFTPSTGLLYGNADEPYAFENETCTGVFLPLHRPTHDKALDKSGNYPYANHFRGRKRLWEMRLQLKFKHTITDPLLFGIQLDSYVPMNASAARCMGLTVAALRRVVGNDLYHSVGDDPRTVSGPYETPVFAMPLWAFDQYIVTPEGEQPPHLADPGIPEMGHKRTTDRRAFIRSMADLELVAGHTYTFCFWGISQFLDGINWQVRGVVPGWSIDYNTFCGKPPVHLVLYTLRPGFHTDDGAEETRHLEARKNYIFRLPFWSSQKPPSEDRLAELLHVPGGSELKSTRKTPKSLSRTLRGAFSCCMGPRPRGG